LHYGAGYATPKSLQSDSPAIFRDQLGVYRVPAFQAYGWLDAGFGTRDSVSWPDPARLAILKQVHSSRIVRASAPGTIGEGDALIANAPGLLAGVRTADCVPILLADTRNRAVAAVHAGWRGAADRIVMKTAEMLGSEFGTRPEDIQAAIGPSIGVCCYEVGPEVAVRFRDWLDGMDTGEKVHLDLREANRRQLIAAGVEDDRICLADNCTCCAHEFHSYRRDGTQAGRMISAIGIRNG
jgi:purine-nucleoside/S-methyl-5'-thioadenosine phosphorylase / adenosine deaminase